jgi:hypothetical protein
MSYERAWYVACLQEDMVSTPKSLQAVSPSTYCIHVPCKDRQSLVEVKDNEARWGAEKSINENSDDDMVLVESSSLGRIATRGKWVVTSGGGLWEFKIGSSRGSSSGDCQRQSPSNRPTVSVATTTCPTTNNYCKLAKIGWWRYPSYHNLTIHLTSWKWTCLKD